MRDDSRGVAGGQARGEPSAAVRPWREVLARAPLSTALATVGGVGLLPGPAGTWGSAAAVLLGEALVRGGGLLPLGLLALASTFAGIPASERVARLRGDSDPHEVVVDEVAGQSIALLGLHAFLPAASAGPLGWGLVVAAFLLFRLLDVVKPGPIDTLQRLPGGLGVMADDVAAGAIVACLFGLAALGGLLR